MGASPGSLEPRTADAGVLPGLARPILVAHGGGAVLAGGDVVEGIERAIDAGVAAVEIDVRRTADGVLVVHHGSVAGDAGLSGRRYADVACPEIPSLESVLERTARRLAVNLELKEAGYESEVVALALQHLDRDRLLVTSFLDDAVAGAARLTPSIATGLIVGRRLSVAGLAGTVNDVFPFRRLRACRADVLVSSHALDLTGMRRRAARRGFAPLVWTINDPRTLREALEDARLLGVVTDRFDLVST